MLKKYGRTFHLPQSPGATSDDRRMRDTSGFGSCDVVVTEKMDGENTTIHSGGTHARSPDGRGHPSRDWMKAFAAGISPHLMDGERIVGEYLFARHSIAYDALPSYFLRFAWIVDGHFRDWDATVARFETLGIVPVRQVYRGAFHAGLVERLADDLDDARQEGFVLRRVDGFAEANQGRCMGKYVRADHVQTETHWMNAPIVPNGLA